MRADLARYKVEYDKWFYESSLHESGYVKETIDLLNERGMLYEKDGALWFKGTEFGMEKDEVLVKSNGFYTYYAVDIAYHRKILRKEFQPCNRCVRRDHHGHVVRFTCRLSGLTRVGLMRYAACEPFQERGSAYVQTHRENDYALKSA